MESPASYNVKLINEVEPPELQDIEVPKVLGDVFEALIGKKACVFSVERNRLREKYITSLLEPN
jgi:hypothetical protein